MRTQQAFTRVHSSSFLQGIIRSSLFIRAASLFTTDKEIIDDQTRIMRAPRKGVEPTDLLAVLQEPRLFKQVLMRAEGKFNTQMVTLEEGSKSSEEEGLGSPCPPFSRTSFKSKSKLVANGFTVNSRTRCSATSLPGSQSTKLIRRKLERQKESGWCTTGNAPCSVSPVPACCCLAWDFRKVGLPCCRKLVFCRLPEMFE